VLHYRILGPLEVERDSVLVGLPAAKHRALLLALLLRRNMVCAADQLIDALWERPPASAAKLLQTYVSQLRSVLGQDAIETVPPGYRLSVEPENLDVCRFEVLHRGAGAALAEGNPELAGSLAVRALSLWRGQALADVVYEPFAEREADRLEELRLQCVEHKLDAALAVGGHEDVLAELAQLCQDHPLRERLHERFALALYRSGRQADALDALATARARLRDEFGLDPGKGLQSLEHAILVQNPAIDTPLVAPSPGTRTVARPIGELVGRERDVAGLGSLLARPDARLVTVTGAGGSGKTRLALEVAGLASGRFANGVVLVELASVRDSTMVLPAVAQALGLSETANEPIGDVVTTYLRSREILLVVDNFEQVIDAAADLVGLVTNAPLLTILVTSRRVLHVTGEYVYPLAPLALDDASRLFAMRAEARDPSLRVDVADDDVREICARLDCLPLAVEIAAARTVALDPRSMRDRLRVSIRALGPGPRDAPARQQTLSDAIRWSTDLLTIAERRALARFSVFVGGSDLATAEAVCNADLDVIVALVEWNLLQGRRADGAQRLGILDTIRDHATELLDDLGEREAAEMIHTARYLALAEGASTGSAYPETLRLLDPDLDNLRAVYDRAAAAGDHVTALRLAALLHPYWYVRGLFREGRDRIAAALTAGQPDDDLQALALRALAGMHYLLGEDDAADDAARLGVDVGTASGALEQVMACLTVRGLVAQRRGELEPAREYIVASATVAATLGRDADVTTSESNLGEIALSAGDLVEARLRFETVLRWHRRHGTEPTFALIGLGRTAQRQGLLDEADHHLTEARTHAVQTNRPHNALLATLALAAVAADRGDVTAAGRLLGWVDAVAAAVIGGLVGTELDDFRQVEAVVLDAVGTDGLADLLREGRSDVSMRVGEASR
jgi:predicted ATPase/DNA-binding SARP family transcriptional activator